jgi:drug/metabolite transporter (DMT)-like permease
MGSSSIEDNMTRQNKAYLYAGTAVLMWSTVGTAFKLTLSDLSPIQMLLFSSFISVIVLFGILLFQKKLPLVFSDRNKTFQSALNGLLNPFLFYIVLFNAYDLLLAQEAMVLNFTWPVTLTLLSILILKQKIGWKSLVAISISFIGIIVIAMKGGIHSLRFTNSSGVMLAMGSTIIWSLFWIINIRDKRDEVVKLFLNFLFGFIYILITALLLRALIIPSWKALAGIIYIGLFEMGFAYIFWLKGLQLSSTTARVSNLIFMAPFISLIIINVFIGEQIQLSTFAGLAFITAGIIMQRNSF